MLVVFLWPGHHLAHLRPYDAHVPARVCYVAGGRVHCWSRLCDDDIVAFVLDADCLPLVRRALPRQLERRQGVSATLRVGAATGSCASSASTGRPGEVSTLVSVVAFGG